MSGRGGLSCRDGATGGPPRSRVWWPTRGELAAQSLERAVVVGAVGVVSRGLITRCWAEGSHARKVQDSPALMLFNDELPDGPLTDPRR